MKPFLLGIVLTLVFLAAAAYLAIQEGFVPAAADQKPGKLERWAAMHSLHAAIAKDSAGLKNPLPLTDDNFLAGARVYAADCLVCHGAADAQPSAIARGLNIPPPQLAKDGVEDDPEGVTFWKVKHGIRFTGMPAYGGALTENQLWQVTSFVSHLDRLPPSVASAWKAMGSAAQAIKN